ncbi:MAG: NAD(P)H-hydrate epimerase [Inhella sp.]|jgi:hydroxyethylthiazole kinase-like uncharacterized protein yjeF|uniref:NAD(P)H-hydrate epimerase n=1 Tax=Inhella sp. TaxID=1921806 RepID=UPI0022C3F6D9|nr:NAD(P)H-hydrate epimerase [Inhella sp.]MCZ8235432.1 NAD(P)H-hydrate epimerase [Inhella sp.]
MPQRLIPLARPVQALFATAMRELETQASQGLPAGSLMARAGLAAAQWLRALHPHARQVTVWCGPGNNGGDGLVMARHLHSAGLSVTVHTVDPEGPGPVDRARALAAAREWGLAISPADDFETSHAEPSDRIHVDALLGIGLREAPRGAVARAVAALRQLSTSGVQVLALDLPSGLDGDRGRDLGAPRCQATLTFLAPKPGLFTGDGRDLAGQLWLEDLGTEFTPSLEAAELWGAIQLARWRDWAPRSRWPHGSHKGRQGDVWVLGGAAGMSGAAHLAGRAALASGAGRVYLVGSRSDPGEPGLMHRPSWPGGDTVVAGCGGGAVIASSLPQAIAQADRLVLDADALNHLAGDADWAEQLHAREGRPTVLTPHPLEAARLLRTDVATVQADRPSQARLLAERSRCTVVLKGSGTVIAHPQRPWRLNTTGHSALAGPGTGDVLAGWLGGLLAQAPEAPTDEVAALAVAWHGAAVDALPLGRSAGTTASTLIGHMAAIAP